jgi:hypothetical protein
MDIERFDLNLQKAPLHFNLVISRNITAFNLTIQKLPAIFNVSLFGYGQYRVLLGDLDPHTLEELDGYTLGSLSFGINLHLND